MTQIITFTGHTAAVTSIGWRVGGNFAYSGSEDGTIKVWTQSSPKPQLSLDCESPVSSVCILQSMVEMVSADRDGRVSLWDLRMSRVRQRVRPTLGPESVRRLPLSAVAASHGPPCVVAASHSGLMHTWKPRKGDDGVVRLGESTEVVEAHTDYITKATFGPKGAALATASADKTVQLWRRVSAAEVAARAEAGAAEGAEAAASAAAASGGGARAGPRWERGPRLVGHQGWVWDAAFNADGSFVFTGSADGTARLWNAGTGDLAMSFNEHGGRGVCAVDVHDAHPPKA